RPRARPSDFDVLGRLLFARPRQSLVRPAQETVEDLDRPGLETGNRHLRRREGAHDPRPSDSMEFFRIKRVIPVMRHALVLNPISIVTFVLAVFFLAAKGLHLSIEFTAGTVM